MWAMVLSPSMLHLELNPLPPGSYEIAYFIKNGPHQIPVHSSTLLFGVVEVSGIFKDDFELMVR
jgi:hypothetical protein